VHRFYHEQLQIDNGLLEPNNGNHLDKFVTWSDNPALVLSYIDAIDLPEGKLAQQYTLSTTSSIRPTPWTAPIPKDGDFRGMTQLQRFWRTIS
jgi:hypothetical protein